MSTAYRYN